MFTRFIFIFNLFFVTNLIVLAQSEFVSGKSYYGRNQYIEYIPGDLPIVISAPHGGWEKPAEIKDRLKGTDHHDKFTLESALEIRQFFFEMTGKRPYIILNRLHRVKLDPNRGFDIAVQGDSLAAIAYNEFHNFIDSAEQEVEKKWGKGFYIDLHAHNHATQLIELGYLLESGILAFSNEDMNDDLYIEKSSLKNLMKTTEYKFSEIIRGGVSFGAMLEKYGYNVVPSPKIPDPKTEDFFSGGYNTQTHGPSDSNNINSLQIELPWDGVRDSDENLSRISKAITEVIIKFMRIHYGMNLSKI